MACCSPCQQAKGKVERKVSIAVTVAIVFGVASVALAVTLVLCQQFLVKACGQWDECKKQLDVLEGKAAELQQALDRVTLLQVENEALQAEVAQQQEQLKDLQSSRDEVQLQNQLLEKQLQDMRSQSSGGSGPPAASFSLLALLLTGMLLL